MSLMMISIFAFFLKILPLAAMGGSGSTFVLTRIFIFGALALLAPIGVGLLGWPKQIKREKQFRIFAAQNGWNYASCDDLYLEVPDQRKYRLFTLGQTARREIYSIASRQYENGQICLLDYYYEKGSSPYLVNVNTTCLAVNFQNMQLPYFALYPEGMFSPLGELFGYNDIDFPSHPNFSSRYKLSGKDEPGIRNMFTPQILSWFEQMPEISIDAGGTTMYIYQLGQLVPVETLHQFVNDKIGFFNVFRQYR